MRKINKSLTLLLLALVAICNSTWGQVRRMEHSPLYVFDQDSLSGFQEEAARTSAIAEGFTGSEFKVRMFQLKRAYVNSKYNLVRHVNPSTPQYQASQVLVPGCTNEDFETATDGVITVGNSVNGWVLSGGTNDPLNVNGANSCNLSGCCTSPPSQSAIFTTPFVDPTIGSQYPIHSVFGTSTANSAAAAAANPQITSAFGGNKVIRINNDVNDYSIEKLSKTFAVTANNSLFQFAFISVFATGHQCCDAGAFRIRLYNASGGNTLIPCPTFSVSAPGSDCAAGPGTPNYYFTSSLNSYTYDPNGFSNDVIYNRWQISSIDLTPYVNQNVTIEIIVTDCTAGGHFGYIYFDAQCGPMTIYGNGTGYPSTATTGTVPTCGAAGATLCAADGLGPYSWAGPGVGPPFTTPSMANQCYTTNLSGTFTLYMNPAGSCAPLQRVINSTITPAPLLAASVAQAVCGSTVAAVTLTPSGSAAVPSTIVWQPTPLSLAGNTLSGTYAIASQPFVTTITATDPLGCKVVVNPTINPAAPIPTFAIVNVTGPSSITCANPFLNLKAVSGYTYGTLNFQWVSANTNSVGADIEVFTPGVFTVTATDPVSQCSVVHNYTVGLNTTPPTVTLSPLFQNVTCLTGISTVSASANPTINISHHFYSPQGTEVSVTSHTAIYQPSVGEYTYVLTNDLTGCSITKTFTVASNDNFPTLNVTSANNFTVGCNTRSVSAVDLLGNTVPIPNGSINYTVLAPGYTSPTFSLGGVSHYTMATPGTYTAAIRDQSNNCITLIPFTVIQDITPPDIGAIVPNSVLDCNTPSTQIVGTTEDPRVDFAWIYPGPTGTVTSQSASLTVVTTSNVTNTLVATYTLSLRNRDNDCYATLPVPIKQNLFPPKAIISGGTNTLMLTCSQPSVGLSNNSTTGIPPASGFPTNSIIASSWEGPPPQTPTNSPNYVGFVTGEYTLTVIDYNNGCSSKTVTTVRDERKYPVVNIPAPPTTTLDCGATNQKIGVSITSGKTGLTYRWSGPSTASITGITNDSLRIYQAGRYGVAVTQASNGCTSTGEVVVVNGTLDGDFQPDVTSGFAPLTVSFQNTSHSSNPSTGTRSITSVWNYGNGTSANYTTTTDGMALYTQPGNYTVTLYTTKGSCTDIDSKVITVDIPSKLEVPNVFTPNGDGVNDLYFLKVSNMTEITATIFDRWGHKVYELTSTTGNIAWDGTNMVGAKVAAGTYFYTIKATGKDSKTYDQKGTISLYR